MKNIVGSTPTGKDFFPREKIVNKIYRRLDSGETVYLSAARRMGKTAIMKHLEENPRDGYEFKYLITESVDNASEYFAMLLQNIAQFKSITGKFTTSVGSFLGKLGKIRKIGASGVEFEGKEKTDLEIFNEYKALIQTLEIKDKKVVLMIDEFPQTVANILRVQGKDKAMQFLQFNREMRQIKNEHIQYILTGSIGLNNLAEKLEASHHINDINTIEVEPLTEEEAIALFTEIFASYKILHEPNLIPHCLVQIRYFSPFYIQLLAQYLIDEYDNTQKTLSPVQVGKAWQEAVSKRSNQYFSRYFERLKEAYESTEYDFATLLLQKLAHNDEFALPAIEDIAKEINLQDYRIVLRSLEDDGYIRKNESNLYDFTAPMLKSWWAQYVPLA